MTEEDRVQSEANDTATIQTAQEFAADDDKARWHKERMAEIKRAETLGVGAITTTAILGVAALIAYLTFTVMSQHTQRNHDRLVREGRNVTVWCYADPNSDRGTSTITGTPSQVRGFCPDAYYR